MSMSQLSPDASKPHGKYERLVAGAKEVPPAKTVIVHPFDETSQKGAVETAQLGISTATQGAKIKGIRSEVAGEARILVVLDLEAGNMLAKNLRFLANADAAGIVLGARVPVILTSRADSARARMPSCTMAVLCADARRRTTTIPAV